MQEIEIVILIIYGSLTIAGLIISAIALYIAIRTKHYLIEDLELISNEFHDLIKENNQDVIESVLKKVVENAEDNLRTISRSSLPELKQ